MSSTKKTIYFGYGSNLWLQQMQLRCPDSTYLGIGRLPSYRWMVNRRGYANVVQMEASSASSSSSSENDHEVYGLVFSLTPSDEARLDINEGVPYAYDKEMLRVRFWPSWSSDVWVDVADMGRSYEREMLVYVNRETVEDAKPKNEYIYRMNLGIKDAVKLGVPKDYVKQVMRKFIPEVEDETVKEVAEKQALMFEDET
ncbi:hypothetical protein FRB95_009006 [Tulasnella sp. JGI-2019a]|nr:hypothetical protein FRB95_009006 [Tulasnella sp. JGI-2019a]